ncbi:heparinase II/III family protein [bacterium]|nr:heparinase II/III family protein [bacterium]
MTKMRSDHPRLFFNKDSFPKIKERALNEERELFDEIKNRIDNLIGQEINFKEPLISDGTQNKDHEYGIRAAEAAFLYLTLKDKKYFDLSKELIVRMTDYYNERFKTKLNIQWYAFSRINTLAAYDWIYNDLTEEERTEMGSRLLTAISNMLPSKNRKPFFRENTGGPTTGFYGPPSLGWYAGIVFHKEGINNDLAEKILEEGYDKYIELLKHRSNAAGDDGGSASAVLGYSMGAYPWAENNFFHTLQSSTGLDISGQWPYAANFPHYVFWNWLPGDREFGYGDTRHHDNNLPLRSMHLHLSQMIHFYGNTQPELVALTKWMLSKTIKQHNNQFPYARFLLTNTYDNIKPRGPSAGTPLARHFENMGQISMRSGSDDDDTYALFTAGGKLIQHRHYDNNNFVIFKKGFLALDTGTRPQPGLHLTHYYCRTIAHNCVLINMPGETMPRYWGVIGHPAKTEKLVPVPNDGGQCDRMGSEITAFDENKHYVYIAGDATNSYHKDKCKLALRQFVFLPPDHFVIFDRVSSTKPEYEKTWLLHTATEPKITDNEFTAYHEQGRLFCRTVFPETNKLIKIGGPEKQFWSGGKNWPMPVLSPDDWNYSRRSSIKPDTLQLLGQWRIEVSPGKPNTDDMFLHLIQVGDRTLKSMVQSEAVKTDDILGIRFSYGSKEYTILFSAKGEPAGKISINQDDQTVLDEEFTKTVKPQSGLF